MVRSSRAVFLITLLVTSGCGTREATPTEPASSSAPQPILEPAPTSPAAPTSPTAIAPPPPDAPRDPTSDLPTYHDVIARLQSRKNAPIPELHLRPDGACVVTLRDPRRVARATGPDGPVGVRVQCPPGTNPPASAEGSSAGSGAPSDASAADAPAPAAAASPADAPAPAAAASPADAPAPADAASTPAPVAGD